tara:strand:+ start:258 stop:968 length:711 start_codon:yes stop_codon:yes gene_type:complete
MADNVDFTPGTGATGATDDIGGVHYPRVKISLGADGAAVDAVAGAGAVSTGVQRTTLASDDPAVALLTTIDADTGAILADTAALVVDAAASEALLTTIDADTSTLAGAVAGTEMQVDVVTSALPTGAASSALQTSLNDTVLGEYETVAASQTAQVLGATGATGDFISHLLVIPATTSPGAVTLLDNVTSITVFAGGASSVTNLVPFVIPLSMVSVSGTWNVTTGANVSVIGVGNFT